jgi:hypothetical protein
MWSCQPNQNRGVVHIVEFLPSKHKALSSSPGSAKQNKAKQTKCITTLLIDFRIKAKISILDTMSSGFRS